jgi:hypothetical protein
MSKFLLNVLVQISKALLNSKIQFLIQKYLAGPASPRVDGVFAEVHFLFWFAPSELAASLSSLCQVGSGCQFRLPPPPTDRCHFLSSPPATPRRPTSDLEMPG